MRGSAVGEGEGEGEGDGTGGRGTIARVAAALVGRDEPDVLNHERARVQVPVGEEAKLATRRVR